jgi:hypothetical protein
VLTILHGAVVDQTPHRFCCLLGGVGQSSVGAVALYRVDELLPGIGRILGDDMQHVLVGATGHTDVDGRAAHGVGEDRVRPRWR